MLNMNFNETVVIETNQQEWQASPMAGVWRKPLAREATEHGHTTSVVRFDPGSYFSTHSHPVGEEILVLEGVFSDEHGDYPAGSYLRHPPGSSHRPFSREGCVIFVKLDQFDAGDTQTLRIDTNSNEWLPGYGELQVMPLHEHVHESVALVKWPQNARFQPHRHFGGEEIYVISGTFLDEWGIYPAGTWIRNPHNSEHCPYVQDETIIWVKTGHMLPNADK
ncbi:MAG: cupin domain-containing protein [Gammaproteobacteria bacterium]|nr:cupin domain-containing protein [Gammaproteobacteria bacterium]